MSELLVRDIESIKEHVDPKWIETFEVYIPQWLESLVPHYEIAKSHGVDVFDMSNHLYWGDKPEEIVVNDVHYFLDESQLLGKTLSFNADYYYHCDWEDGMEKIYTAPVWKYCSCSHDWMYYHHYLWRFLNRKAPYDIVRKRVEKLFQQIIGDESVIFDFGCRSYILFNPSKLWYINNKLEA